MKSCQTTDPDGVQKVIAVAQMKSSSQVVEGTDSDLEGIDWVAGIDTVALVDID